MPTVCSAGALINYSEAGQGEPIVFLHSLGASSGLWAGQLEHFGGDYRCIAVDSRGHGSSTPGPAITREQLIGDVVRIMDHCQIRRAHVVGLSMGGCWALGMREIYPDRLISMTICNSFLVCPNPEAEIASRASLLSQASMTDYGQRASNQLRSDVMADVRQRFADSFPSVSKQTFLLTAMACFYSAPVLPFSKSVSVPSLVLTGSSDSAMFRAAGVELAASLPDSRFHLIPDAGHIANLDNPSDFNARLAEFLNEVSD